MRSSSSLPPNASWALPEISYAPGKLLLLVGGASQPAKKPGQHLFTGRRDCDRAITTRQYARLVGKWIASIGLDPSLFGTHSLRRTKATLIYRRTGNLRAVQLLLGHKKIESTVR